MSLKRLARRSRRWPAKADLALDREKGEDMAIKRGTKATKRGKRVKDLALRKATAQKAKGGTGGAFEIKDFSFGIENPMTIGSATGGAGAGKTSIGEIKPKGK